MEDLGDMMKEVQAKSSKFDFGQIDSRFQKVANSMPDTDIQKFELVSLNDKDSTRKMAGMMAELD